MDWAEIDSLLWLAVVLALVYWIGRAAVAWMQAQGWIPDSVAQGILGVIP